MLTVAELKSLLRTHGLRLTKRLGQHHLIDERMVRRIIDLCRLSPSDQVVEIGPGLGALTEELARRAGQVVAVEVDRGICALLAQRLSSARNIAIRCEDILEFSWQEMREAIVVGAIPYHISSPILVRLCEARRAIRRAVIIVQDEVANRLLAAPGTKAYGRLSVLMRYCWDITGGMSVPRHAFFPQPEVDSRCLALQARSVPPVDVDEARFFEMVKGAFAQRRKTLVNSLTASVSSCSLSPEAIRATLRQLGLPMSVRGEALSIEQFAALTNLLHCENPLRERPLR